MDRNKFAVLDFLHVTVSDVVDILVVAAAVYYVYRLTKGTRTPSILVGIFMIYILWFVASNLNMELMSAILSHLLGVGVIAIIVLFQPEIRRFLQILGTNSSRQSGTVINKLFTINDPITPPNIDVVNPIVKACSDMAYKKVGALIVLKQSGDLSAIEESGVAVDAVVSAPLLCNIFFKNSPLHDGAIVIADGRIVSAKCILPTTAEEDVPLSYGMRHRAALGMSEQSDAKIVVVSEETGLISLFEKRKVTSSITPAELRRLLLDKDSKK